MLEMISRLDYRHVFHQWFGWLLVTGVEIVCNDNNLYCEIIINRGVLIFADFVIHLNHEN